MSVILENLTVCYQRHPAIHHLSGQFDTAEATAIFGPNGAGKSTLLKTMIGALRPDSGRVNLGNFTRKDIAYLPQQSEIDRSLPVSVLDLVCTGLWHQVGLCGRMCSDSRMRAREVLDIVGLADFARRPIFALSSGQFQRVLFARILLQDARIILLDEPFAAIDAKTTYDLLALLQRWCAEGRTIITVLHDYEQVRAFFPKTLLLAREIVAWGETDKVLTDANLKQAVTAATSWRERVPICSINGSIP